MKLNTRRWRFALASLSMTYLLGCTSSTLPVADKPLDSTVATAAASAEGVAGGITQVTETITATVTAIDSTKRTFVLQDDSGNQRQLTAPPQMINFPQLKVGDRVVAQFMEETLIFATDSDMLPADGIQQIAAAPDAGNKPGLFAAEQVQVTATVIAVDVEQHTATLEYPDKQLHTVNVRSDVDLSPLDVGKKVVTIITSTVEITVTEQKP